MRVDGRSLEHRVPPSKRLLIAGLRPAREGHDSSSTCRTSPLAAPDSSRTRCLRALSSPLLALSLFFLLAATALAQSEQQPSPALPKSPQDHLLVVFANLEEALDDPDVADPTDMENFAARVASTVPYAPDILLVGEVTNADGSIDNVADLLSAELGYRYEVSVDPGPDPRPSPTQHRFTGILLNADTVQPLTEGGFVQTAPDPGDTGRERDHAHQLIDERNGRLQAAVVSLHLHPGAADSTTHRWSGELAAFMQETYSSPSANQVDILAGDFNQRRCEERPEATSCTEHTFWDMLTRELGYRDVVFERYTGNDDRLALQTTNRSANRIDYIFAKGATVLDATADVDYPTEVMNICQPLYLQGRGPEAEAECRDYYADHRYVWALLTGVRVHVHVRPTKRRVRSSKRRVLFRFRVANTGHAASGRVRLCAQAPRKRIKVARKRCYVVQNLNQGTSVARTFRFRIKPRARGRRTRIKFSATGPAFERQRASARLVVRR